jgi:hypothetical protein
MLEPAASAVAGVPIAATGMVLPARTEAAVAERRAGRARPAELGQRGGDLLGRSGRVIRLTHDTQNTCDLTWITLHVILHMHAD